MNIKIYQINPDRDKNKVMFASLEDTETHQESSKLDPSIYDRVFTGDVDCEDLEEVYKLFNTDGHRLNRGHLKRFLAIYFEASMNGEQMPDSDGEQFYGDDYEEKEE